MINLESLSNEEFLKVVDLSMTLTDGLVEFFYLYKIGKTDLYLRRWNRSHVEILEYTDEELYNKKASDFFSPEQFEIIKTGINGVIKAGRSEVEAIAITKSGREIPCLFSGNLLCINNENYLLGFGINISNEKKLKNKLLKATRLRIEEKREKKKIDKELALKKQELVTTALQFSTTAEVIIDTIKTIDKLIPNHTDCKNAKDLITIKSKLESHLKKRDNWETFRLVFKEVHQNFFDNLKKMHPRLTKSELKFAAYLRIRLSSSQIMTALNISKEAIRKARYRLRKKLGLKREESLEDYISQF